jgi:integrase
MSGHIQLRSDLKRPWCFIKFPYDGKVWVITRTKGRRMYDEDAAERLLHHIQKEVEEGTFNPLKYTKGETNVITFLHDWLEECKGNWTPGTQDLYRSYIKNHIEPFFKWKPYQLNEVRKKCYQELKTYLEKKHIKVPVINGVIQFNPKKTKNYATVKEVEAWEKLKDKERDIQNGEVLIKAFQPEYVKKVVDMLRAAMFYAFDCEIIGNPPPRIHKKAYQIPKRKIRVTTIENQQKVIAEIQEEHRAIYQFCALHTKVRPANVMVLKWEDYDSETDSFIIQRGISGGTEVDYDKTKELPIQAVHPDFKPMLEKLMKHREFPWSPYVFTCHESKHKHKRYTKEIFNHRWNAACKKVGIKIDLYHGTRHTTATDYANKYTPEQTKILLGHKTVETTMKYYAKVNIETERALMTGKVVSLKKAEEKPVPDPYPAKREKI